MSSKLSVLVVDDSPDGREMLVEYLAFRRFQVAEAGNGAEALDVARRVQPNIILTFTAGNASTAKNPGIRSASATDARRPRTRTSEESSR